MWLLYLGDLPFEIVLKSGKLRATEKIKVVLLPSTIGNNVIKDKWNINFLRHYYKIPWAEKLLTTGSKLDGGSATSESEGPSVSVSPPPAVNDKVSGSIKCDKEGWYMLKGRRFFFFFFF